METDIRIVEMNGGLVFVNTTDHYLGPLTVHVVTTRAPAKPASEMTPLLVPRLAGDNGYGVDIPPIPTRQAAYVPIQQGFASTAGPVLPVGPAGDCTVVGLDARPSADHDDGQPTKPPRIVVEPPPRGAKIQGPLSPTEQSMVTLVSWPNPWPIPWAEMNTPLTLTGVGATSE